MPVDPVVVRRRLLAIGRSLRVLRALRARCREAFLSDEVVQDRAEWHAQLLAQACADVAVAILAGTGAGAPETYAEALSALAAAGVIPAPLGARLADAVRLRNILVHGYSISTSTTGGFSMNLTGSNRPRSSRRRSNPGWSGTPTRHSAPW